MPECSTAPSGLRINQTLKIILYDFQLDRNIVSWDQQVIQYYLQIESLYYCQGCAGISVEEHVCAIMYKSLKCKKGGKALTLACSSVTLP